MPVCLAKLCCDITEGFKLRNEYRNRFTTDFGKYPVSKNVRVENLVSMRRSALLVTLGLLVILSGCTGNQASPTKTITEEVKELPTVKQFLSENPNASMESVHWRAGTVDANKDGIHCGSFPVQDYQKVSFKGKTGQLTVWYNIENRSVQCITKNDVQVLRDEDNVPNIKAVLGDKDAPVTVKIYCRVPGHHCSEFFTSSFQTLRTSHIETGDVKAIYHHFPLDFGEEKLNKQLLAAQALECVQEQEEDAFWEMLLIVHEEASGRYTDITESNLATWASRLDVNGEIFSSCIESRKYLQQVRRYRHEAQRAGIDQTPLVKVEASEGNLTRVCRGYTSNCGDGFNLQEAVKHYLNN